MTRAGSGEHATFAIRDLSLAGARLIGDLRLIEGEWVRVVLAVDGTAIETLAEVIRTEPQSSQAAIAFRDATGVATAAIARLVEELLVSSRSLAPPRVLVLHPDAEARASLQRDLGRLDQPATACATVLEAIWAMSDRGARYEAFLIGSAVPQDRRQEVLRHLAEHHPAARRILVFGEQVEPIDHASASHVDAILRAPWRMRALSRALGLELTDSSAAMLPATIGDDDADPT